jgi:hypothetical protein
MDIAVRANGRASRYLGEEGIVGGGRSNVVVGLE